MLVSSLTGKPLAKPWATFLTDAYSRRVLACYVTFDPPSYRSAMMAFRLCVQRYERLPRECFVDRGPEFGSVYFESLQTRCFVTKLDRPPSQPRFGSVVERLFGTTTTELLNQLRGNTQASKTPRLLTREVDPKRLAVWTLPRFASRLSEYVHEVYDQVDHPALGQSPREAFEQGMTLAGSRSHRLTVPVRYEPYDMGVAYAYIGGQWLECIADAFALVHGRSEREWDLILDEWREQQRQHGHKRITLNGPLLTQFLQQLENDEALLLQRQRDLEEQAERSALLLKTPLGVLPREAPPLVEVDLTKIPQYEEYI